jgi:putative colanic acid biosynthesis acetyltransferase WcaF
MRTVSPVPRRYKALRLLWSMVQNSLFRYSFHTWSGWRAFLLRCFGAKIGRQCTIRRTSRVYYPWLLEMGDLACLGDDCSVYNLGRVSLMDHVTISQEAYLCAGTHDHSKPDLPLITRPITVGKDAWICARAFVGPGVTIGEGAVVGACAVVMRDVAPWKIVAGNRATVVGERRLAK